MTRDISIAVAVVICLFAGFYLYRLHQEKMIRDQVVAAEMKAIAARAAQHNADDQRAKEAADLKALHNN